MGITSAYVALPLLARWRTRRFLSPSELAEAAHVSRLTIYHAEAGKRVKYVTARALAKALEIEPAQLCEAESIEAR